MREQEQELVYKDLAEDDEIEVMEDRLNEEQAWEIAFEEGAKLASNEIWEEKEEEWE